jgi:DNA-binding CsgD family transcriptional regulator
MLDLSRCAARSRRPAEASSLSGTAADLAAAAGATLLSVAAQAHLSATDRGSGEAGPPLLTARESEVARLVAGGATNREIAAALTIAPKTVAAHIEHILAMLGATRRTQIASWVATRRAAVTESPGAHHVLGGLR